MMLISA